MCYLLLILAFSFYERGGIYLYIYFLSYSREKQQQGKKGTKCDFHIKR